MSKKDIDDIQKAIAAIDARKKKNIFVRGGSTGMVQQKHLKNYPNRKPNSDYVYPNIKKLIKDNYKHIDIVFMHGLSTRYYVVEEDAEYINSLDSRKNFVDNISYYRTSISKAEKSAFINMLNKKNKGYVFMDMIPNTNPILRKVVDSSDLSLINDDEY